MEEEEYALRYEYLLRRAFQCGRYGVEGANADEYRRLERKYIEYRDNKDSSKIQEVNFNYGFQCGEISAFIKSALERFAKDYDDKFLEDDNEELEEIRLLLYQTNIEKIEEAIKRAEELMIKFEVYPK